jgi:tRNA pseudouridine38-40 synthase
LYHGGFQLNCTIKITKKLRYFLDISYQGANYHGWQIQENAVTVQGVLEKALTNVLGAKIDIVGSGRTDTGVHAASQIIHLDSPKEFTKDLIFRINGYLPKDICIKSARLVKADAHARFDAISRAYVYRITLVRNPFEVGLAYYFYPPIDIAAMNTAAAMLLEHEDFESFSKVHTDVSNFNCTIHHAYWEQESNMLYFHIKANRFLRGMVRTIVGTLLEVGKGRMSIEEFTNIILAKDRKRAGISVPADALYLSEVIYPESVYAHD